MADTTSPDGGADTLAPTTPAPTEEPKQTIILGQPAGDTSIRPFSYHATDDELAELRRRIAATRWPERETVDDDTQGVRLDTIQKLADHWLNHHDWRKVEARINGYPNFVTEVDGLDMHFIHVKSKHAGALPLIVTHGWPGSVIEQLKIIEPLTDPTAHGGSAADAFDVVIPSMPGYGFSGKPSTPGWGPERIASGIDRADEAARLRPLRRLGRRLGRADHRLHRGAGAARTARHPHQHGRRDSARNRCCGVRRGGGAGGARRGGALLRSTTSRSSTSTASAMRRRWANRPQTLIRPRGFAGRARGVDHRPRHLDLSPDRARVRRRAAGADQGRHRRQHHALLADQYRRVVGPALLGEQERLLRSQRASRFRPSSAPSPKKSARSRGSWAEQAYPELLYYRKHPEGAHFAAWEQPQAIVDDLRNGFRSLR